ncbi:MAG: DUF86 domain-containing protein [Muribaculaceae bacterium]|nr:DUF86 domain-containing protein [Muribaculaceae bacterium]
MAELEVRKRLCDIDDSIDAINGKIVNTRNYIIHGYDSLDNEILWSIVINHLPKLKAEIKSLLSE